MDEYMNLVIDNSEELSMKKETRKPLGTAGLKLCFVLANLSSSLLL